MSNFTFNGSHGTCISVAEIIEKNGFIPQCGIRGLGVYFWEDVGEDSHNILAKGWNAQCKDKNKYSGRTKPDCAIFNATISSDISEYLDLENRNVRASIVPVVNRLVGNSTNTTTISNGYDRAIQAVEQKNNVKVKVLTAKVTGPRQEYCRNYNFNAFGNPLCIIARESGNISNVIRLPANKIAAL